jgi:SAM-dependent methyltransferase
VVDLDPRRPASQTFVAGENWLVVCDDVAIPLPGGELAPIEGGVVLATRRSPADLPVVHTLAELERAGFSSSKEGSPHPGDPPAIAFSVSDCPPASDETVREYVRRLLTSAPAHRLPAAFAAIVFDEPSGERPEIVGYFPARVRRLLDVGCGAGKASAAIRRASPRVSITGIERNPADADRARSRMDRVIPLDATRALGKLANDGERFDAFLFADVLEHLENPVGVLTLARELAAPGATLVASVPNVAHLSLVRDLVAGRFDPVPAGLADAGHLRWFTRSSLQEALDESGWSNVTVTALPGAPAPEPEAFLNFVAAFPEFDRDALETYQWVAVARAE